MAAALAILDSSFCSKVSSLDGGLDSQSMDSQYDRIRRFLKVLGNKFCRKCSPNSW